MQGAADGRAARLRGGNEERKKKKILERSVCRDTFNWEMFCGLQRCGLLARFPDGYVLPRPLADRQMITTILPECTRPFGRFLTTTQLDNIALLLDSWNEPI